MDQPARVTDPTGLFVLKETEPDGSQSYRHRRYPWNTLFTMTDGTSNMVSVSFPPHRRFRNKVIPIVDIKKALEDTVLFANRFFLDDTSHSKQQLLTFSPSSVYAIKDFYDEFKQTFQTPLTRSGYLPSELLIADGLDSQIIRAYNNPDARTYDNFNQFVNFREYQKVSPEQLAALYSAKPRTALIYLYYGDNPATLDKYLYSRSQRPKTNMTFLGGVQKKENSNALRLSIISDQPVMIYAPSRPDEVLLESTSDNLPSTPDILPSTQTPITSLASPTRFIPIVRYAAGMRRGLYFANDANAVNKKFCGTFYYYEPDSNFFLSVDSDRYLIFDNKYLAVKRLAYILSPDFTANLQTAPDGNLHFRYPLAFNLIPAGESHLSDADRSEFALSKGVRGSQYRSLLDKIGSIDSPTRDQLIKDANEHLETFRSAMNHKLYAMATDPLGATAENFMNIEKDMKLNLVDLFMSGGKLANPDGTPFFLTGNDFLLPDGSYTRELSNFYASEDAFDQILCQMASVLGFDVIILTKMVGSSRVVSEVLDTREREDSFKAIYEIIG